MEHLSVPCVVNKQSRMNESRVVLATIVSKDFWVALESFKHSMVKRHRRKRIFGPPRSRRPLVFELRRPKLQYATACMLAHHSC